MIYVASPYYHFDKQIIETRVAAVAKYCGKLLSEGIMAISPVPFGHKVLEYCSIPNDFSSWDTFSYDLLDRCNELHVLRIEGWEVSRGVTAEIKFAKTKGIKIVYVDYKNGFFELVKTKREKVKSKSASVVATIKKYNSKNKTGRKVLIFDLDIKGEPTGNPKTKTIK